MKKLIELFKWDYEGEYQQYFYVVEDEESFVKEVLKYLNEVQIKEEFYWDSCLENFKEDDRIQSINLVNSHIFHLDEVYFIDYVNKNFSLSKRTPVYTNKRYEFCFFCKY